MINVGDLIPLAGLTNVQKEELVNTINDMTTYENEVKTDMINKINAVSTENPLNLPTDANWFDVVSSIPNIKTHDANKQRKFKIGTALMSGVSNYSFIDNSGTTFNTTGLSIKTLDFIPSIILVWGENVDYNCMVTYQKERKTYHEIHYYYSAGQLHKVIRIDGTIAYVKLGDIRIPCPPLTINPVTWLALE